MYDSCVTPGPAPELELQTKVREDSEDFTNQSQITESWLKEPLLALSHLRIY